MITNQIGSEFWIYKKKYRNVDSIPKWITKFGETTLTSTGRGAIALILDEVQPKIKTVLLPNYICESVIMPFAEHDYICFFYDTNLNLTPEIEMLISQNDIGIFLHMGYFGFPTNSGLADIIKRLKSKGSIIVEDVTHTLFSNYPRLEENDYYVGSIRKWMGLPSGGFLAAPGMKIVRTLKCNDEFANIRENALLLKGKYVINSNDELKLEYSDLFARAESIISNQTEIYNIDETSKNILATANIDDLRYSRTENFTNLSNGLKNINGIEAIFTTLPEYICPIFFPIYVKENRDSVQQELSKQGIYCPVHWPLPSQIDNKCLKNSKHIYDQILSIPCDQRYNENDMERIIFSINQL